MMMRWRKKCNVRTRRTWRFCATKARKDKMDRVATSFGWGLWAGRKEAERCLMENIYFSCGFGWELYSHRNNHLFSLKFAHKNATPLSSSLSLWVLEKKTSQTATSIIRKNKFPKNSFNFPIVACQLALLLVFTLFERRNSSIEIWFLKFSLSFCCCHRFSL